MRRAVAAALLVGLAGSFVAEAREAGEPVVLFDFETGEPADGWTAGGLTLRETTVERGASLGAGRALSLVADGAPRDGRIGFARCAVAMRDWRRFRALAFAARVDADAPVRMRVMAYRGRGPAALLRRFELAPGGWRDVELPLSTFREDTVDPVCDFSQVDVLLFRWDATPGRVTLDDVRLVPGERGGQSSVPTAEERAAVLFPGGGATWTTSEHFVLLTDVAEPGDATRALLARCEEGLRLLRGVYGIDGAFADRAPVVVCRDRASFETAIERLGAHYGVGIAPPRADGLSVLGVALGSLDAESGWERPSLVHESVHAALHRLLGISTNGNWVHEGLASAVQARLFPASVAGIDFASAFEARARGDGPFLPLGTLCAEQRTSLRRYPQYMTVFDFLAARRSERLPAVWAALRDLRGPVHEHAFPALCAALGTDADALEAEWLAWGRETYPGAATGSDERR